MLLIVLKPEPIDAHTNDFHVCTINNDYTDLDSFVIYMCVSVQVNLNYNDKEYILNAGETILLPAVINKIEINSKKAKLLEVYY